MNVKAVLAVASLAIATTAYAADGSFERNLNTGSSPNLNVSTGSGSIHLKSGSGNQVHIVAKVHGNHGWMNGGSGDVDSRIQQIINNPPVVQNGNDITIGERHNNDLYSNISI